jgi:hypothetical protein
MTTFTAILTMRDNGVPLSIINRAAKRAYACHEITRQQLLIVLRDCRLLEWGRGRAG